MDADSAGNRMRALGIYIREPLYLMIPAAASRRNLYLERPRSPEKGLILTYLGRAELWKVNPCISFLEKVSISANIHEVHIVTDSSTRFRAFVDKQRLECADKIIYHEGLFGDSLNNFLLETSDLHYAMGTSALNGAGLGIPTILIDAFSDPSLGTHARYRWIFETHNYSLGEWLTPENTRSPGRTAEQLVLEFTKGRRSLSDRCLDYVGKHHDPRLVISRFIDAMEHSGARLECVRRFLWPQYIRQLLRNRMREAESDLGVDLKQQRT